MKIGIPCFVAGFAAGALAFGGSVALAASVAATPSAPPIYVDGRLITPDAYMIEDRNYLQLRDMAIAVNFSVVWDGENRRVLIDTAKPYVPDEQYFPLSSRPQPSATSTGDVIRTTDGDYIIKKGKPAEEPLPAPDTEWKVLYTAVTLPDPTPVRWRGTDEFGDYDTLSVFNAHETQRMIETIYRYAPNNPSLWTSGKPDFAVSTELTEYASRANHFYPWRESEIEKQVMGGAKVFKVYAVDIYSRGNYQYTMYCIDPALS